MNLHSRAGTCPRSRAVLVERVLDEGWSWKRAAQAAHVSERTVGKWLRRFREEGPEGLRDRSSRPQSSPTRTKGSVRERILALRAKRLTVREIFRTTGVPSSTVSRILRGAGVGRLKSLEPPEPANRYERERPGDLLHVDIKKLGRIVGGAGHRVTGDRSKRSRNAGWEYLYVCVDDHSRLSYVEALPAENMLHAADFMRRAILWFEQLGVKPLRVLSDNGKVFTSGVFSGVCESFGVKRKLTRPYRPRTNGKAERFIQTLLREWAYRGRYRSSRQRLKDLPRWLHHYNYHRAHSSLEDRPPASRVNNLLGRDS